MRVTRTRVAAAVVAAVLLAGCGALSSDTTPTQTVTPVDVPRMATETVAQPDTLPTGVTQRGVTDPFALARAHHDALTNQSYTVRTVLTIRYANGTLRGQRRITARVTANGSRFLVTTVTRGPNPPFRRAGDRQVRTPGRSAFFSDSERLLYATTRANRTTYHAVTAPAYDLERWASLVTPVTRQELLLTLNAVETALAGQRTDNGTTLVVVRSTGRTKPGSAGKALSVGAAYQYPLRVEQYIRSVTLTAFVAPAGLVREHEFTYVAATGDDRLRVTRRVRYTDVGTTAVDRPDWYERALNATDAED